MSEGHGFKQHMCSTAVAVLGLSVAYRATLVPNYPSPIPPSTRPLRPSAALPFGMWLL